MKKIFAFISLFAIAAASIFADVTVKKLGGDDVEVTFFYGNPRASEVLLAGDFTNWQNGALPMEKGDKGFSITKTFKKSDELRYKFISDGNWPTDLKAPDFVDDGFGGKNSHVVIADMLGGDDDGAPKAKINFISWTMLGVQANYITQGKVDATKKGLDLDSVTVGFKSYDKFAGQFLPGCPLYIEIALAETELENYDTKDYAGGNQVYLYQKDQYDNEVVEWEDGLKDLVNGLFANPVAYLAKTTDNWNTNPFLGHLKFGFNTPYINFTTGFNYAKPDVRNAITWKTIDGNWDAGYQHVGGFNVFSLGDKAVAALEEATGISWDIGFAPNKTADRKGYKYGYWAWAGIKANELVVDFQSNGMYDGTLFDDPVEHDFIIGAKNVFALDDAKLKVAAQALIATHQKSSKDIADDNANNTTDYFGYSTDVFYRSGDFDGIKNIAANVKASYEAETFSVGAEYRLRGAEASMLYVRENHDDGTFDLSEMLGNLNTQKITLDATVSPMEALSIGLNAAVEMPLEALDSSEDVVAGYAANVQEWYAKRCGNWVQPWFLLDNGSMELTIKPTATYKISDNMSVTAYADMNYRALKITEAGADDDEESKYDCSDNQFRVKQAGASLAITDVSDVIKGINVYYGLDLSNVDRYFNTLVGQVNFPGDVTANVAFGIKTENTASADGSFDSELNNPFAFALGVSKKLKAAKKPTVYAQFVYNMDPFKHFGDGQDQLNLDRANVKGSWAKDADVGDIDPVDWYDGRAALRCGIRWDI